MFEMADNYNWEEDQVKEEENKDNADGSASGDGSWSGSGSGDGSGSGSGSGYDDLWTEIPRVRDNSWSEDEVLMIDRKLLITTIDSVFTKKIDEWQKNEKLKVMYETIYFLSNMD